MPLGAPATPAAAAASPQIFLQEDQKDRSLFGFTRRPTIFGATRAECDRPEVVKHKFVDCSSAVIAACIEVHKELGPGLLEGIYEESLCDELTRRGLAFERQKPLTVRYKGRPLEQGYRADLIVAGQLLVELKAVDALAPIHVAQAVTYLKLAGLEAGLLVNFNSMTIRGGLRRVFRTPQTFCSSDLPVKKSGAV
jgi:GxxExxY protein